MRTSPVPGVAWQQRGFTLVEIMVVVVILGLLATMVAQNVMRAADEARLEKASIDCRQIAGAARMFYAQRGRLPSLAELLAADEKGARYLEEIPRDPWGSDYELRAGDLAGDFEVRSVGKDRCDGGGDDISSKSATQ